jgi:hypothetical protein
VIKPLGKLDSFLKKGSGSGGYTRIPNILFRHGKSLGLDRSSFLVLQVILSLRKGDTACVSVKRLADDSMLSLRQVNTCLKKLESAALIQVTRARWFPGCHRHSNVYDLSPLAAAMEAFLAAQPWKSSFQAPPPPPTCSAEP